MGGWWAQPPARPILRGISQPAHTAQNSLVHHVLAAALALRPAPPAAAHAKQVKDVGGAAAATAAAPHALLHRLLAKLRDRNSAAQRGTRGKRAGGSLQQDAVQRLA